MGLPLFKIVLKFVELGRILCDEEYILTCVFVWQVGGLADVVTGLGRSLLKKGHRVEIIIPKYKCMDVSCVRNFKVCNNYSLFGAKCGKLSLGKAGFRVYFLVSHEASLQGVLRHFGSMFCAEIEQAVLLIF
jgi:hypothetical protein